MDFNNNDAKAFLAALGQGNDRFTFQTFDDKEFVEGGVVKKRKDATLVKVLTGDFDSQRKALEKLNAQAAGVFVLVNQGNGRTTQRNDLTYIRAVFADYDNGYPEAFALPPSIEVETSPGKRQFYWLIGYQEATKEFVQRYERVLGALAKATQADDCLNANRVLRCPGFWHQKKEPQLTKLVACHPDRIYTLEQFEAAYPSNGLDAFELGTEDIDSALWPPVAERIKRARNYLAKVPHVTEAQNQQTYYLSAILVNDFAIPEDDAFELLVEYNPYSPELPERKLLRVTFDNGAQYAGGGKGSKYKPDQKSSCMYDLVENPSEEDEFAHRVNAFCNLHKVTFDFSGGCYFDGNHHTIREFTNQVLTQHDVKLVRLNAAVSNRIQKLRRVEIDKLRDELVYSVMEPDYIPAWVESITGMRRPEDVAATRHWFWCVKRKIFGLPVEHHLMLVLGGKSGSGKSFAAQRMLEPLGAFQRKADLGVFSDSREYFMFGKYFVLFLDELAKARNADVASLKRVISDPENSYRVLGTNEDHVSPNICTFLGTTNPPLYEIINDPTSARRYYQLEALPLLDWNVINTIPYKSMWKACNEQSAAPILAEHAAIARHQEKYRARSVVEDWLEWEELEPGTKAFASINDLYENLKDFQKLQNREKHIPKLREFESAIKQAGFAQKSAGKRSKYGLNKAPEGVFITGEQYREEN